MLGIIGETMKNSPTRWELDLTSRDIKLIDDELTLYTDIKSLKLSGNTIKNIPNDIAKLKNLEFVDLSNNQIESIPDGFFDLKKLKSINLSNNPIENIQNLGVLQGLQNLDISNTRIKNIDHVLLGTRNMLNLKASNLSICEVPAEIFKMEFLNSLELNGNKISLIPSNVIDLFHLKILVLNNNDLTMLSKNITNLQNLKGLSISGNRITKIESNIRNLKDLEFLFASDNIIEYITDEITELCKLRVVDFSRNKLTAKANVLFSLPCLERLNISHNCISEIKEIPINANINEINISNNRFECLPGEIWKLQNLRKFDFSSNYIQNIPANIGSLKHLIALNSSNNPISSPPPEIVELGLEAILAFLKERQNATKEEWVSKLIIVGEGGVGKTSLLRRLTKRTFRMDELTTHGLTINPIWIPHPNKNVKMRLNTWDFGGQHILHATHQFFLTDRSLFILVWNVRLGWEQGKLYYWLDSIKAKAPQSPVIIVATHNEDWNADLPYKELIEAFPNIVGRFEVSNLNRTGINELSRKIQTEASALPLMGKLWPKKWYKVAECIRNLKKEVNIITPNRLIRIMEENKVKRENFHILPAYLHDLGDILFFMKNDVLKHAVILNPEWIATNISLVLESKFNNDLGLFTERDMDRIWAKYDSNTRHLFLKLMEEFDLSYQTPSKEEVSIVVEKLSFDPPENMNTLWEKSINKNTITVKFHLNTVLPAGIPTWFIARTHRFTTYRHWRYGALFSDNSKESRHYALVQAFNHERYLQLCVRGPVPYNFFALLQDGLELTLKRYPGLKFEKKMPCPCTPDCLHEFVYDDLEFRVSKNKFQIECPKSLIDIDVRYILFGLTPSTIDVVNLRIQNVQRTMRNYNADIVSQLRELKELTQRSFLKLLHVEQVKLGSVFPRIFVIWREGRTAGLQLYCEAPGCIHLPDSGGRYEIPYPYKWLPKILKYTSRLLDFLTISMPIIKPGIGIAASKVASQMKVHLKLMSSIISEFPDIGQDNRNKINSLLHQSDNEDMLTLRELLVFLDPNGKNYGLTKILTKEGHVYWVCPKHYIQYQNQERFTYL